MLWNALLLSLREIRRNLMRSFLTTLGVVIGVSAVITMVTLGNGATRSVQDQIASMGSNLLMVRPGQRFGPPEGAPNFKLADAQAIREQSSAARAVAPVASKSVTAVHMAKNWSTSTTGSTNAYFDAGNWRLADGRTFTEAEERAGKAVCVVGETVRRELFGSQNPVGDQIRIKQFACEVIGLLASKGQSAMGRDQDDTIVMPIATVQRRLTGNQDVNMLMVGVAEGMSADKAKQDITLLMRERRRIGDGENDNFMVMDTRQIAEALTGTTRVMTMLLGAVAAVSLLVGGIGIMNIMLVSVTERTREIGLRMAVGARSRDILGQFLVEAVTLALVGGILGILLGVGGSALIAMLAKWSTLITPTSIAVAFGSSAFIGIFFGYFPARKAAYLDPIEALRYE